MAETVNGMEVKDKDNSFRGILRNTSIFGGVQVFLILVNLIRGKLVALILGPEGMGVSSLFSSAGYTLVQTSSLGLNLAVVKEVAQAGRGAGALVRLVCRLGHATALLGALLTVCLSGWLSELTFGSPDYRWQFIFLAVFVYFTIAANAKASALQGMHQVRRISVASLIGASSGLAFGVPLYYFFGTQGIVPALGALGLSMYIFYSIHLWRLRGQLAGEPFRLRDLTGTAKRLVSLGMVLVIGDVLSKLGIYVINLLLRTYGDMDTVGLYQAANSITAQYVGTIVAALSLDYFPRLSAAAGDNAAMGEIVNRQSLVVALLMGPACTLIIATAPLLIRLLLSPDFLPVVPLVKLFALGMLFKVFQSPMGYISFAKGNRRVYFLLEGVAGNVAFVGCAAAGFMLWGLNGLGYGMIAENILFFFIYWVVNNRLYGYNPSRKVMYEYSLGIIAGCVCFGCTMIGHPLLSMLATVAVCVLALGYSLMRLRRLMRQ